MSSSLCQYKNMFGEPNKGVHSYRFMGVAVVDVVMTVFFSLLFSVLYNGGKYDWKIFVYFMCGLFLLGIVCHRLFCVKTTVDKALFGNSK